MPESDKARRCAPCVWPWDDKGQDDINQREAVINFSSSIKVPAASPSDPREERGDLCLPLLRVATDRAEPYAKDTEGRNETQSDPALTRTLVAAELAARVCGCVRGTALLTRERSAETYVSRCSAWLQTGPNRTQRTPRAGMRPRATQWSEALRVVDSREGERRTEVQLRANGEETAADGMRLVWMGPKSCENDHNLEWRQEEFREEFVGVESRTRSRGVPTHCTDARTQAENATERSKGHPENVESKWNVQSLKRKGRRRGQAEKNIHQQDGG
ncbi:hypothetical protein R3P38DRAFT_3362617 [Favolaschia claudopus]|uniref:Uncharacterized protein n=1 Tax=Favolaschia claudopus TaxID=2862362 RepID=A0AAW0APC7_9AGAR